MCGQIKEGALWPGALGLEVGDKCGPSLLTTASTPSAPVPQPLTKAKCGCYLDLDLSTSLAKTSSSLPS